MIGRLEGTLVEQDLGGTLVVDVQGVGYEVRAPEGTLGRVALSQGGRVVLHVHTYVRDDSLTLYGFATLEDRTAFRALIGVSSIGPKLAIAILSRLDAQELASAVARQDKIAFKGITGVGKRTVERLLIDLQGKLRAHEGASTGVRPKLAPVGHGTAEQTAVGALVQMGYKRIEAESAVGTVAAHSPGEEVEGLLRAALVSLG